MSARFDSQVKNNLVATIAPIVTDDGSNGYSVNSGWIDVTNDKSYICVDATIGAAVWQQTGGAGALVVTASDVTLATGVGTPTVDQMQELIDSTGSSGYFEGGLLSLGTGNTLDVSTGSGFIRTTADPLAQLLSFKWSAVTSISLTNDSANYVFVDNTGAVTVNVSEFIEAENKIMLGVIIKEAGVVVSFFNFGVRLEESIAQAGRFLRRTLSISRDVRRGGLVLGETGTRNITLSAGHLWWGRTDYTITAINTSGADTFDAFYQDGVGGVTIDVARTNWNNTQYDDGSGTLATLANNKWAVQWFFIAPDGNLSMVYGTTSNSSLANAELEKVPTVLPPRVSQASILVGRLLFQKSAATATIESAFDVTFVAGSVTGFSDPMTTIGDMIVRDATNATARLGVGTVGQFLKSDGTNISWGAGGAGTGDFLADGSIPMTGAINEAQGIDIASATTTDIGAGTGNLLFITGTTTITGLGTVQAGVRRELKFVGALILTHNATSLILPTGANITTVADDRATFISLGAGNWICTNYQRADGTALVGDGAGDILADGSVPFTGLPAGIDPFQSLLINALGTVNQRGITSPHTTTVANEYGLDRWRVPTSGDQFKFVESVNKVIYEPPASGIEEVIEGKNVQSQTYTISWVQETLTTTCTVGGTARTNGESFVLVGGTDTIVNFKGGTFSLPQITLGSLVKPFEHRDYATELLRCQRYYKRWIGTAINDVIPIHGMLTGSAFVILPTDTMRSPTSVTAKSSVATDWYIWDSAGANTRATSEAFAVHSNGVRWQLVAGSLTNGGVLIRAFTAGAWVEVDNEL